MTRRLVIATVVMLLMAPAAGAHDRVTLDPDDSPGPLDIVAARVHHRDGRVHMRAVTYEQWTDSTLSGELDYVRFDLTRPGREGAARCAVIHLYPPSGEGPTEVEAPIYKNCNAPLPYRDRIGTVDAVFRPDLHSLTAVINPKVVWKRPPRSFMFRAHTSYENEDHPDCQPPDVKPPEHFFGTCSDVTPWRRHNRR